MALPNSSNACNTLTTRYQGVPIQHNGALSVMESYIQPISNFGYLGLTQCICTAWPTSWQLNQVTWPTHFLVVTRSHDPNCCIHINKRWTRRWNWNYSISSHKVGIIIIPWINFVLYQKQKFIAHSEYNFDIQRIRQSVILPKIVVNIHEMEIIPCSCTCLVKHSCNQLGPWHPLSLSSSYLSY